MPSARHSQTPRVTSCAREGRPPWRVRSAISRKSSLEPLNGSSDDFLEMLSPERARRARRYSRTLYSLYFIRVLMGFAFLLLILRLGIAVWLRNFAESLVGSRWLQAAIFMPAILVILDLGELPVSIYGHSVSLRYEQSIQRWGSWLAD